MKITINIPNGRPSDWTVAQLVTFMSSVDGIYAGYMEDCKETARKIKGSEGGKIPYRDHVITVSKTGKPTTRVEWQGLAKKLLAEMESSKQEALIKEFTSIGKPSKQRVTIK